MEHGEILKRLAAGPFRNVIPIKCFRQIITVRHAVLVNVINHYANQTS